jgi:DNA mismatch endonuclease (patch repair protein)
VPDVDPVTRRRMQSNRRRDTAPEMALRRVLHSRGLRYRVDYPLPLDGVRRRCDVAFPAVKVAVFVDGCWWHSCPEHGTLPKRNSDWWRAKLDETVARDRDTDQRLAEAGWVAVRVWEHEPVEQAAARVENLVRSRQ